MLITGDWKPRDYQFSAWDYLQRGGKHAELIWHRRAGKDDIALRHAAVEMHKRPATYWHMLPQANQVRKAIWESVNPHTGIRRIYEAFPPQLFEHRESDMLVKAKANGATWQCLGSDNYEGAIGSPPAGIVFSEWALANPSARGYLRPILAENDGYQIYITTPRGKNHAYRTYKAAQKNARAFAQKLTVYDTKRLTSDQLNAELEEYTSTYGEDMGRALFEQEYLCSFDAAILGAVWGAELRNLEKEGRYTTVPHDPDYPVFTAWDIGRTDATAIWFFQVIGNEPRIIDFVQDTLKDPDYFAGQLLGREVQIDLIAEGIEVTLGEIIKEIQHRQAYDYQTLWLPHDAKAKTFAAKGKSVEEQLAKVFGWAKVRITPDLSKQDGIQAARKLLNRVVIDESTEEGFEAVKQYHYEWDDDRKKFKDTPEHDWTSHPADALRYLGVVWQIEKPEPLKEDPKFPVERTFNQMVEAVGRRRRADYD